MEKFKCFCRKALNLHWAIILLLTVLCGAGLGWVFLTGHDTHWLSYPIYVLSFYTLIVLSFRGIPKAVRVVKAYRAAQKAKTVEDREQDFHKSLIKGVIVNLGWALIQMFIGYFDISVWTGSQGAYTLIMAFIMIVLLFYDKRQNVADNAHEKQKIGWKGFRTCGIWLFILHLTMTGQVFLMIWRGETEHDNEILVIGVAAYTFYKLILAIIRVVQYKNNASPLWGAASDIDLSEAMMNLYILQASMLSIFGSDEQEGFRFLMNSLVGIVVCLMTVGGSIGMIFHGNKRMKETEGVL